MPRYIYRGDTPRNDATTGIDLTPGETFESPVELESPLYELVGAKPSKQQPEPVVAEESAPEPVAEPAPEPQPNPDEEVAQ